MAGELAGYCGYNEQLSPRVPNGLGRQFVSMQASAAFYRQLPQKATEDIQTIQLGLRPAPPWSILKNILPPDSVAGLSGAT